MAVSYQTAGSMALILDYATNPTSVVKGLNKLGIPGMERSVVEVQEFRNDLSRQFVAGGKLGRITFSGNYVTGDTNGQDALKAAYLAKTSLQAARVYINTTDFITCDLANDPSPNGWQVSKYAPGEADINGVIPFSGELVLNGRPATFTVHKTATTIGFTKGSGAVKDTITDSGNGFVTAGFLAGQTIIVDGSTSNDGQYLIYSVEAGTITLTSIGSLTTEIAGDDVVLDGGTL